MNTLKKKNELKKNSFVQGAFIASFGVIISKMLGILYVIPFHSVIGEKGGALYGYAYTIYMMFMAISTAGIPLAISKIISEYHTLGYENAKDRAFKLGKQLTTVLGLICFVILFIFAPQLAAAILGELTGGSTIEEVTLVIRVISTAIIIVPVMSVYRGYFEGHKFISPTAFSQVLEQIVRVTVIVAGSFVALKVFNLSLTTAVGVAVFGATLGALATYIYLIDKRRKNKTKFSEKQSDTKEPVITNKEILKKLFMYALPFIMIDVVRSLYSFIDTVTVIRTLGGSLNYSMVDAEIIMGMMSTWAAKFNMIIISIAMGVIISLIPNLTASFVVGNMKDVRRKINQTLQILLFLTMPMTIGLSFLATPVWTVFYGQSTYGPVVLSYFVFVALILTLFTTSITIVQVLKYYKQVFISLVIGLTLKATLNVPLMYLFDQLDLPAFYGAITATIIAYAVSFVVCLITLKIKCEVKYKTTVKQLINIVIGTALMGLGLFLMSFILPRELDSRFMNIFIILAYAIVGAAIYFTYMLKTGSVSMIFGDQMIEKIKKKLLRR